MVITLVKLLKILAGNFLPSFDTHFHEYHVTQNWSKSHLTRVFFSSPHPSGSCPDAIAGMVLPVMGRKASEVSPGFWKTFPCQSVFPSVTEKGISAHAKKTGGQNQKKIHTNHLTSLLNNLPPLRRGDFK